MSCAFSSPLSEEQIIAALDNEVPPDIAAHLRDCPDCRARFEAEQAFEGGLMQKLFRVDCPTLDKLRDYAFDLLIGDIQRTIEQHLQRCRYCRQEITSMKNFSDTATAQLDNPTISRPSQPQKWPLVPPNAIIGSSASINSIAGFRGRGFINGVMLDAVGVAVSLEAEQNEDNSVTISGQFIVPELVKWNEALVELWQDGQLKRFTVVDDTGAFECSVEHTDNIRLVVINRSEDVVIFNDINFPKQYGKN